MEAPSGVILREKHLELAEGRGGFTRTDKNGKGETWQEESRDMRLCNETERVQQAKRSLGRAEEADA